MENEKLQKRIEELEAGIMAAIEYANGRQDEWGDRAVEAFEILERALRGEQ